MDRSLKYRVFKDLWERGKYVTAAESFGGDFLLYPGDPLYFHASHIVHCVESAADTPPTQLVCCGRLSVLVNKFCVFVHLNEETDTLIYQTMEWQGKEIGGVPKN